MFGYIKVYEDDLKVSEYRLYKSVYCGLCKTMKSRLGTLSALTLSYDFVFLALLCANVSGEGFTVKTGRCGFHPFKKLPVAAENDALRYAASAFAVLKYFKLRDDLQDSVFFRRTAVRIMLIPAKSHMKRAIKKFPEFRLEALSETVSDMISQLTALENEGSPSCERNADIFGKLLRAVFSHPFNKPEISEKVGKLGYCVGNFIYIADACDDFSGDRKKGQYNPFISAGYTDIPADAVTATVARLNTQATEALAALPSEFDDLRSITENILKLGMPAVFRRTLSGAVSVHQKKIHTR